MMLDTPADGDGFGGGDTDGATALAGTADAPGSHGEGGGDFGEGFEVASGPRGSDAADSVLADDADGFGGGILPGERGTEASAQADPAFGLAAGEADDGSGYGGGGGVEEQTAATDYAASDDGEGFGGGSVA